MTFKLDRRIAAAGSVSVIALIAGCASSSSTTAATSPTPTTASAPASSAAVSSAPAAPASSSAAAGATVKTASTSLGTVLVNSQGLTIYWFAPDTSTKSNCSGACATYWPPVPGPVTVATGVSLPGHFGTITRSDGTVQATYDGHPLYTYVGDHAAGQVNGNAKNLSGGLWYATTPSGTIPGGGGGSSGSGSGGSAPHTTAPAPAPSPKTSSAGGGYGY
jgi:predicted lipoprotein with Yx(FWY)xxD motif